MADPEYEIVAVFEDERAARSTGVGRVADDRDEQTALRAEMREETDCPLTARGPRRLLAVTVLAAGAGAILFGPFGFVPFGDVTLVSRLFITGGVGAAAGATLGFVLGGGLSGAEQKALAAERGTTVAAPDTPAALKAVVEKSPIRVDRVRVEDGQPVATVAEKEES